MFPFRTDVCKQGGDDGEGNPFAERQCVCERGPDGEHGDDCPGEWVRALNVKSDCYLYIHTISFEVESMTAANTQTSLYFQAIYPISVQWAVTVCG